MVKKLSICETTLYFFNFQEKIKKSQYSSIISFVNNGLLILQENLLKKQTSFFFVIISSFCFYSISLNSSLNKIFHFSKSYRTFNSPPLNLGLFEEPIYCPQDTWRYLGFIFNKKLSFQQHFNFCSNKTLSIVKCMKMLDNFAKDLLPHQKHLLYKMYIFSIVLYEFQLWYFNKAPLLYLLKKLRKMQQKAVL